VSDLQFPSYIKILRHSGENATLVVMVEPHDYDGFSLKDVDIQEIIRAHDAEQWLHNPQQIETLLQEQNRLKETRGYNIAQQRDCSVAIAVSPGRLNAWITLKPAYGGKTLTRELLQPLLEESGVVYGIKEDFVSEILQAGRGESTLIAEGYGPVAGVDARIEQLFQEDALKGKPHEREDGSVDFFELGLFLSVQKGAELMRKHPATPGVPGMGVDAKEIPAIPGKDLTLTLGPGTAFSSEDPNLVIAVIPGQPIFGRNTVKIVQKLELKDVDFQTGNIDFEGSVLVRGSIKPGFKVKAGNDLVVSDTMEGAELTAGANLELRGGAFGKKHSRITAKGNIKARFLDGCIIHCGGNLEAEDLISNCTVNCDGGVHLGKKGGRGQIYGGKLSAVKGVFGKLLGSVSEVETHVEVSPSPTMMSRQAELEVEINRTEKNLENLERSLGYLRRQIVRDAARINSYVENCTLTNDKLQELRSEFAQITEKLLSYSEGAIKFGQTFPGVTVQFGKRKKVITSLVKDLFWGPEDPQGSPTRKG
jgi:hypothetical protein